MMQQYLDIRADHADCILFFRLGDFYEMFFEDAVVASQILNITLTAREGGIAGKVPMCGVPYHAAETYIERLIKVGRKVAICEQVEDATEAKGIVKREVVRIITPATYVESPRDAHNFIGCWVDNADESVLASVDYTTGYSLVRQYRGKRRHDHVAEEILRLSPRELLVPPMSLPDSITAAITRQNALTTAPIGLSGKAAKALCQEVYGKLELSSLVEIALAEIISYLQGLKVGGFAHFTKPVVDLFQSVMTLDLATRRNLEITFSHRHNEREGSLIWVLDYTITAMGARTIKQWLLNPLTNLEEISARLTAVEVLFSQNSWRAALRAELGRVYDLERLLAKVTANTANPKDLLLLAATLVAVGKLKSLLQESAVPLIQEICQGLNSHEELHHLLHHAINPDAPQGFREGKVLKSGFSSEVDELRAISLDAKATLASFEAREKELTGIKSLKVGYNRVFGYYLEATNTHLTSIPTRYHRKQTLANGERYITEELKDLENTILSAEDRLIALEESIFLSLRAEAGKLAPSMINVARQLASLDILQSFAEAAFRHNFSKPEVTAGQEIIITNGRHPVVEKTVGAHAFVPNDTGLQQGELAVLTGPNMAGKSTYMRQVALIVLMAQVGSFVPADKAVIGYVDRIFTRVGAADDLFGGHSTFMVEMLETSAALAEATSQSLILFDEVGRGTSTYDGMALAQAIMEYVHDQVRARTIFSTHYHELTELALSLPSCRNYVATTMESGKEVVFLHRIVPGKASKSYGIHVARMAGLPAPILKRAVLLLKEHEKREPSLYQQTTFFAQVADGPAIGFPDRKTAVAQELYSQIEGLAPEALTPLQALNLLYDWKRKMLQEPDEDED